MKKENPCKGCEDRYIGCHDSCFRYGKWKEEREVEKARRREYYEQLRFFSDIEKGGIKRCKK